MEISGALRKKAGSVWEAGSTDFNLAFKIQGQIRTTKPARVPARALFALVRMGVQIKTDVIQ